VQNHYNLAHRADDALIDDLARDGTAYVPFFPLGGFTPLQSSTLSASPSASAPAHAGRARLAASTRGEHPSDPRASSVAHLRENLAAAEFALPDDAVRELDGVARIGAG
jgi:pyridoxine 4-dehydrogenase